MSLLLQLSGGPRYALPWGATALRAAPMRSHTTLTTGLVLLNPYLSFELLVTFRFTGRSVPHVMAPRTRLFEYTLTGELLGKVLRSDVNT